MKRLLVKGFTLIELMIVIAIIAILAAIAIPAYQGYTARAQLSEAFVDFAAAKTAIQAYIQGGGTNWNAATADSNSIVGLGTPTDISGNYVKSVTVAGSLEAPTVTALIKSSAAAADNTDDKEITWTGTSSNGVITWGCSSNLASKYLPATCSSTA